MVQSAPARASKTGLIDYKTAVVCRTMFKLDLYGENSRHCQEKGG